MEFTTAEMSLLIHAIRTVEAEYGLTAAERELLTRLERGREARGYEPVLLDSRPAE